MMDYCTTMPLTRFMPSGIWIKASLSTYTYFLYKPHSKNLSSNNTSSNRLV
jgi:hypothetical protein